MRKLPSVIDAAAAGARPAVLSRSGLAGLPWIDLVYLAFVVGLFLTLKSYSVHPTMTDDWIYAYMARRVTEGALPYRDFFFAHPPLHLFALAASLPFLGFTVAGVRAAPALATALSGVFVWMLARRLGGRIAAFVALPLFLLALDVLRCSSHITGTNLALMLWLAGAAAMSYRRWRTSGALLGGAALTALYTIPLTAGLVAVAFVFRSSPRLSRDAAWRTGLFFAICFAGVQLLAALPAPQAYVRDVYQYHGMKKENREVGEATAMRALAYHALHVHSIPLAVAALVALGLAGGAVSAGSAGSKQRKPSPRGGRSEFAERRMSLLLVAALAALYGLFCTTLREVYTYYLLPLYALLAGLAGLSVAALYHAARTLIARQAGRSVVTALAVLVVAIAATEKLRPRDGDNTPRNVVVPYTWDDAPLPPVWNQAIRAAFWRNERRAGDVVCPVTRYLWHESDYLSSVDSLVARVKRDSPPEARIAGDSHLAPLVALLSGHRIPLDEADTNTKRFSSGLESMPAFLGRMDRPELTWIVVNDDRYIDSYDEFRHWRQANFSSVFHATEPGRHEVVLAKRKGAAGAGAPSP